MKAVCLLFVGYRSFFLQTEIQKAIERSIKEIENMFDKHMFAWYDIENKRSYHMFCFCVNRDDARRYLL